jgi:hypothetical protein
VESGWAESHGKTYFDGPRFIFSRPALSISTRDATISDGSVPPRNWRRLAELECEISTFRSGPTFAELVDRTEGPVFVDDLDLPLGKMTEAAQRVIDRAVEESRRREHLMLASEHVFYALAQVEWDLFAQAMREAEVSPHEVLRGTDEHLRREHSFAGRELRVSRPRSWCATDHA